MADERNITPEKQLLRLIEGQGKDPASNIIPGPGSKRNPQKLVGFGHLRDKFLGKLSFLKRTSRKRPAAKRKMTVELGTVNIALGVLVAALVLYVAGDAIASVAALRHPTNFTMNSDKNLSYTPQTTSALREAAFYMDKVSSRDIFHEKRPVLEKKKALPSADNGALKIYSLVGISWSSNPDAIIEDKEKSKTYFVKRGQIIGDNVKVEAIFKDKVVLSKDEQEFELR